MGVKSTDVISQLGVRTQKGRNLTPAPNKGGTKVTGRETKGVGVDKNAPKTPTKNNTVSGIMNSLAADAKNKY